MQTQDFPFSVKRLSGSGEVEGFAAAYGNLDRQASVILPGAFARSLAEHRARGTAPAMLLFHDTTRPVGRWDRFEERPEGLFASGRLALDTPGGAEAFGLLKSGALAGLSVGFAPRQSQPGRDRTPELVEADLLEVSFVSIPANPLATVTAVRSAPGPRELEKSLRSAGLSQRQARAAAGAAARALSLEAPELTPLQQARFRSAVEQARAAIKQLSAMPGAYRR